MSYVQVDTASAVLPVHVPYREVLVRSCVKIHLSSKKTVRSSRFSVWPLWTYVRIINNNRVEVLVRSCVKIHLSSKKTVRSSWFSVWPLWTYVRIINNNRVEVLVRSCVKIHLSSTKTVRSSWFSVWPLWTYVRIINNNNNNNNNKPKLLKNGAKNSIITNVAHSTRIPRTRPSTTE